jgi:hypothetical protein
MQINETELRRLVFIAQQRRSRRLAMPTPTVAEIEADNPLEDGCLEIHHKATVASIEAYAQLLNYLEDCLDMRSEWRKKEV